MNKMDAKRREEIRKKLMGIKNVTINYSNSKGKKIKTETPTTFLKKVNDFVNWIGNYDYNDMVQRFPIETYMHKVYDLINLNGENLRFQYVHNYYMIGFMLKIFVAKEDYENKVNMPFDNFDSIYGPLSAINHIYSPFSEMGCIQYLHFSEFGGNFTFMGRVLTSVSDMYSIIISGMGITYRFVNKDQVLSLLLRYQTDDDFEPSVVMHEDKCIIEWTEGDSRGISYCKYELDKGVNAYGEFTPVNARLISREYILQLQLIAKF